MSHCPADPSAICEPLSSFFQHILLPGMSEWMLWIPAAIGLYLVIGMFFGCPYCFTPDLLWPVTLVLEVTVPVLYRNGFWPERWRTFCRECGEEIPPFESVWTSSEFEGRFCTHECLEQHKEGGERP